MRHSALQVAWALLAASAAARVVPLSPAKLPWKLHSKTLAAAPAAAAGDALESERRRPRSPLLSAGRFLWSRSPFKPALLRAEATLQSAARAALPQGAVVSAVVGAGAARLRRHTNVATACCAALAVLPLKTERFFVRSVALGGIALAVRGARREAVLELLAAPLRPEQSYALVADCGSAVGQEAAVALAQRGFGLVIVARQHADAKALARKLRLEHGVSALAFACPKLETDAAASVRDIAARVREANLTEWLDVVVHAAHSPPSVEAASVEAAPAPSFDAGASADADDAESATAPVFDAEEHAAMATLQARCSMATHLCRTFVAPMAERGRGRCALVIGSDDSSRPPAAFATRATLEASDAFTLALADSLRQELARSGVGVTVAHHNARPHNLLRRRPPREPTTTAGERFVAALLRGDAHVDLHTAPYSSSG